MNRFAPQGFFEVASSLIVGTSLKTHRLFVLPPLPDHDPGRSLHITQDYS